MTTAPAPAPSPLGRAYWLLADSAVLTARSLRHNLRQFDALLLSVILPLTLLLMFVYVFGGALHVGTAYIDYVVPGILISAAGYAASQTAVAFSQDLTSGAIDRFRSLPMSSAALLTGHVTASLLRNLLSTLLVLGTAVAIGFSPATDPLAWIAALGTIALYILAICWISIAFGTIARSAEGASGFTFFVLFLPYVSSAYVPPDTMPAALRPFAEHQFVTPVIETLRGLLLGTPTDSAPAALAWCLGILAVTVPASAYLFRRRTRA
ncbi:ABC transporter permease [Allonocardiopsis opalescens]|uniref:Transport permease protein n=1 Tax=Allonocardiopsis opalescens TaxID=1144618 RepID=A0A2T0Q427_9ACTN|nr:ABC transporter permease [Allonocardiopsis opalescens]PRX98550.1 ABC-2 type transport system permease protein [Allonocardiopsis opalescens]